MKRRRAILRTAAILLSAVIGVAGEIFGQVSWIWIGVAFVVPQVTIEIWLTVGRIRRRAVVRTMSTSADGLIDRPDEVGRVVALLLANTGTVAIATGLTGAGGFGKTTLATLVRNDPRILKAFPGQPIFVSLGQTLKGAALAAKINDLVELLGDDRPGYADPESAGAHLIGQLGRGPRRLLILDDIWDSNQITPFQVDGTKCALLVTTRMPDLLPANSRRVDVDQMSYAQARSMLAGSIDLPASDVAKLVEVSGRWPLLLSLVAARLQTTKTDGGDVAAAARLTLKQLESFGPSALDITATDDRTRAVSSNIGLSLSLLPDRGPDRFAELAVFEADARVPLSAVARLWAATSSLPERESHSLCRRLGQLSLVRYLADADAIELHSVIRAHLLTTLGDRVPQLHALLLGQMGAGLAKAKSLQGDRQVTAWWTLPATPAYMRENLALHSSGTGNEAVFDEMITDLRWLAGRLVTDGPVAPIADLSRLATRRSIAMGRVISRAAHLLGPMDPREAVIDILISRMNDDPEWQQETRRFRETLTRPHFFNHWPLPDIQDPSLRRTLAQGHTGAVDAIAIAPDESWLASGGEDGRICLWKRSTGALLNTLTGHEGRIWSLVISPDSTWLASASDDGSVRIWDRGTGEQHAVLSGASGRVPSMIAAVDGSLLAVADGGSLRAWYPATNRVRQIAKRHRGSGSLAISADGEWLAGGSETAVRIWEIATGKVHHKVKGHSGAILSVALSADARWLASASADGTAAIWDILIPLRPKKVLSGHTGRVISVKFAPSGDWLCTLGIDGDIRIWNTSDGKSIATLPGNAARPWTIAISPDSAWIASIGIDGVLRTWSPLAGQQTGTLTGHAGQARCIVVAPSGEWLATGGEDHTVRVWDTQADHVVKNTPISGGSVWPVAIAPDATWIATSTDSNVRIWNMATQEIRATLVGHTEVVRAIAIAPDGNTVATSGNDRTIRIWDAATHTVRTVLTGHTSWVLSVAIAPSGAWIASSAAAGDGTVRVWDLSTGKNRLVMPGHTGSVWTVAIAPDGKWIATGADDRTIRVWDALTGHVKLVLTGHGQAVRSLSFSSDGRWIASSAESNSIRVWSATNGSLVTLLKQEESPIWTVIFSPSGKYLASCDNAGRVRIWTIADAKCVAAIRLEGAAHSCVWTHDSCGVVVTGERGIYYFDLFGLS